MDLLIDRRELWEKKNAKLENPLHILCVQKPNDADKHKYANVFEQLVLYKNIWSEQEEMVRTWHQALLQELRQIRQPAVVFTHFMVLNAIVGALTGDDRVVCFLPDNASVTTVQWAEQTLQLVELGQQLKTVVH